MMCFLFLQGRSVEVRAFGVSMPFMFCLFNICVCMEFRLMYCPRSIPQARGAGLETVVLTRPMDSRLEHIDFSLLFSTLSPRKIIQIFSSLLLERRVILCANSLSLLSGCAHALLALLYPFEWQVTKEWSAWGGALFYGPSELWLQSRF